MLEDAPVPSKRYSYFVCLLVFEPISCRPGWPQICYIAKDNLELLIFVLLPPEGWDYRCVLQCLLYVVLGIEPRTLCMMIKHSVH